MNLKALGKHQCSLLYSLRQHGSWCRRSGWIWDTPSRTERILASLVRRGLVARSPEGAFTPLPTHTWQPPKALEQAVYQETS